MGNGKTKSSRRWLERQHSDTYVKQAKIAGYRARSAYKLLEIQARDKILREGMSLIELGAAPGGWSQVAANLVGHKGKVVALDILPIKPLKGVDILQGDCQDPKIVDQVLLLLQGRSVDLVISDMAPNLTGIKVVDDARAEGLAEVAYNLTTLVLKEGGTLLVKVFQGAGFHSSLALLKTNFRQVVVRKPKASRVESKEVYLLAKGYNSHSKAMERLVS